MSLAARRSSIVTFLFFSCISVIGFSFVEFSLTHPKRSCTLWIFCLVWFICWSNQSCKASLCGNNNPFSGGVLAANSLAVSASLMLFSTSLLYSSSLSLSKAFQVNSLEPCSDFHSWFLSQFTLPGGCSFKGFVGSSKGFKLVGSGVGIGSSVLTPSRGLAVGSRGLFSLLLNQSKLGSLPAIISS